MLAAEIEIGLHEDVNAGFVESSRRWVVPDSFEWEHHILYVMSYLGNYKLF